MSKDYIGKGDWKWLIPCAWCGKTYSQHDDPRPEGAPTPKVPCLMLKSGFVKRKTPMPPSPQYSEKLREEWNEWVKEAANNYYNYGSVLKIFEWWLSKMAQREQEIFGTYDEYVNLLAKEIDGLAGIAYAHGWRGSEEEYKKGTGLRAKIQALKSPNTPPLQ